LTASCAAALPTSIATIVPARQPATKYLRHIALPFGTDFRIAQELRRAQWGTLNLQNIGIPVSRPMMKLHYSMAARWDDVSSWPLASFAAPQHHV
jgi:hypothetical protein